MLEAGYTQVCEFHYVHHDQGGSPMPTTPRCRWHCCVQARTAGIGMTLLPVLYQSSGFGAKPR
jgi:formimidoylglutamate deiminase